MTTRIPQLTTPRLVVREFEPDDLSAVSAVLDACFGAASHEVRAFWLRWTIDSYRALGHMSQPPYADRAVCLPDGTLVGCVGVVPSFGPFELMDDSAARDIVASPPRHNPEVGLFWALAPSHRGHGYATEAAGALIAWLRDSMALRRVVATTEHDNAGSIAVMERLGMTVWRNPHAQPAWFQVVGVRALTR